MDRGTEARSKYPRRRKHGGWKLRFFFHVLIVAVVFVIGVLVGKLCQTSRAESVAAIGEEGMGMKTERGTEMKRLPSSATVLDVNFIDQRGAYPTGCESVTAVMALNYVGIDIAVEEFIDNYLPQAPEPWADEYGLYHSCHPAEAFMGSPYSEDGWGCYAPVIQSAAGKVLEDRESGRKVRDLTGESLETLCRDYIDKGVPVMIWATMWMDQAKYGPEIIVEETGERYDWISPEHCLLLVGEDKENYYFNDPLEGKAAGYNKASVEAAYAALGTQALVIE